MSWKAVIDKVERQSSRFKEVGERNIFTRQPAKSQSGSSERVEPGTLGCFFKIQVFMIVELLCSAWIFFFSRQGKADKRKRKSSADK